MSPDPDDDPGAIRSLAVSAEDVVDAFVYTRENPGTAVLRATPPFHGRMRARLHVFRVEDDRVTGAVHVAPDEFLTEAVVESYPSVESTGAADGPDDPDTFREERAVALDSWREAATNALVDSVTIDAHGSTHRVSVARLD